MLDAKHYEYAECRHSVKSRLESSEGLSLMEFTYQALQGHDWAHLHATRRCLVQLGGNDQLGNMVAGQEVLQGEPCWGVLLPLITDEAGNKFGKSAGENSTHDLLLDVMAVWCRFPCLVRSIQNLHLRFLPIFCPRPRCCCWVLAAPVHISPRARSCSSGRETAPESRRSTSPNCTCTAGWKLSQEECLQRSKRVQGQKMNEAIIF